MSLNLMVADAVKTFGIPVVIRPGTTTEVKTSGVLDGSSEEVDVDNAATILRSRTLTIPASAGSRLKKGTPIRVGTTDYAIESIAGDGILVFTLELGAV